jgi:hypothetical protein
VDYRQMTSPCGLDCFNCSMFLANEDLTLRAGLAEKLNLPYEEAACGGCRNDRGTIGFLGSTEPCDVYKCTSRQGIAFCCECLDFPCDHLHPYADKASVRQHNTKVFNLCLIRKMGLESWAKDKALRVKETYFKGTLRVHSTEKHSRPVED